MATAVGDHAPKRCCTARREPGGAPPVSGPAARARAAVGDLVRIPAQRFRMGSDSGEGYAADGEGPARLVHCDSFRIAPRAVSNAEFQRFVQQTGYLTGAERHGWSFVFHLSVAPALRRRLERASADAPWWLQVPGAFWAAPAGPGSDLHGRMDHPVTHVAWDDAMAYCAWSGTRLPSEAEWECAARGGLHAKTFPWGDTLDAGAGVHCNIWRGAFPGPDTGDRNIGTVPAAAYAPNAYGLYNLVGNVWEWCADWFSPAYHRVTRPHNPLYLIPTGNRSLRGGSFLCHRDYCYRYRVAARSANTPDSSTANCGFRVAAD